MLRDIHISPVLNGFIVQAGCQKLAYTSIDKLILDLGSYLRDPEATERRILKEEGLNRKYTLDGGPAPVACDTSVPQPTCGGACNEAPVGAVGAGILGGVGALLRAR